MKKNTRKRKRLKRAGQPQDVRVTTFLDSWIKSITSEKISPSTGGWCYRFLKQFGPDAEILIDRLSKYSWERVALRKLTILKKLKNGKSVMILQPGVEADLINLVMIIQDFTILHELTHQLPTQLTNEDQADNAAGTCLNMLKENQGCMINVLPEVDIPDKEIKGDKWWKD